MRDLCNRHTCLCAQSALMYMGVQICLFCSGTTWIDLLTGRILSALKSVATFLPTEWEMVYCPDIMGERETDFYINVFFPF